MSLTTIDWINLGLFYTTSIICFVNALLASIIHHYLQVSNFDKIQVSDHRILAALIVNTISVIFSITLVSMLSFKIMGHTRFVANHALTYSYSIIGAISACMLVALFRILNDVSNNYADSENPLTSLRLSISTNWLIADALVLLIGIGIICSGIRSGSQVRKVTTLPIKSYMLVDIDTGKRMNPQTVSPNDIGSSTRIFINLANGQSDVIAVSDNDDISTTTKLVSTHQHPQLQVKKITYDRDYSTSEHLHAVKSHLKINVIQPHLVKGGYTSNE